MATSQQMVDFFKMLIEQSLFYKQKNVTALIKRYAFSLF